MSVEELEADMQEWLDLKKQATREKVVTRIDDVLANIKAEQEVAMAMEKQPQPMDFVPNADELNGPTNVFHNSDSNVSMVNMASINGIPNLAFVPEHRTKNCVIYSHPAHSKEIGPQGRAAPAASDEPARPTSEEKFQSAEARSEKSVSSSLQYGLRAHKRQAERRGDLVKIAKQLRTMAANMPGAVYIRKATREEYAKTAENARTCILDCLDHHFESRSTEERARAHA